MSFTQVSATADPVVGPLEERYRLSPTFRNASDTTRLTRTHWHIAAANGLGWMFDGMDGVIMALIAPLVIKEFGVDLPTWRTGGRYPSRSASRACSCGRGSPIVTADAPCSR